MTEKRNLRLMTNPNDVVAARRRREMSFDLFVSDDEADRLARWRNEGGLYVICSDGALRNRPERDAHHFIYFGEHYPKFMERYFSAAKPRPSVAERIQRCLEMLPMHFDRGLSVPPRIGERNLGGVQKVVKRYPFIMRKKTYHAWLMAAKEEAVDMALVRMAACDQAKFGYFLRYGEGDGHEE